MAATNFTFRVLGEASSSSLSSSLVSTPNKITDVDAGLEVICLLFLGRDLELGGASSSSLSSTPDRITEVDANSEVARCLFLSSDLDFGGAFSPSLASISNRAPSIGHGSASASGVSSSSSGFEKTPKL